MNTLKGFLLVAFGLGSAGATYELCKGFVPDNDLWIEVGSKFAGGITEEDFHAVIDNAEAIYTDIVRSHGGNLVIERKWDDGTVNAYASRRGNSWIVSMFGGLARHHTITSDGFALVVCHEIGHHIGGAPKYAGFFNRWASNEGQSDYYAGLKCLRRLFENDDNLAWVAEREIHPLVWDRCTSEHSDANLQAICMRISYAGESVAMLFKELRNQTTVPQFDTPDTRVVDRIQDGHPDTQCRMDTYFAGATCAVDKDVPLSQSNYRDGTCITQSHYLDTRPNCWFKE